MIIHLVAENLSCSQKGRRGGFGASKCGVGEWMVNEMNDIGMSTNDVGRSVSKG